jgi:hypothetical protein
MTDHFLDGKVTHTFWDQSVEPSLELTLRFGVKKGLAS